jgi:hypothetical protein
LAAVATFDSDCGGKDTEGAAVDAVATGCGDDPAGAAAVEQPAAAVARRSARVGIARADLAA